jgi:hypothetical protein
MIRSLCSCIDIGQTNCTQSVELKYRIATFIYNRIYGDAVARSICILEIHQQLVIKGVSQISFPTNHFTDCCCCLIALVLLPF